MEQVPTDILQLLTLIERWTPLSNTFRQELAKVMHPQHVEAKTEVFGKTMHVSHAWFSVDCWAACYRDSSYNGEEVVDIFRPWEIFTNLSSFLKSTTSNSRVEIISGSKLLSISKADFTKLKTFQETSDLLSNYQLETNKKEIQRMNLLWLKDPQKTAAFAAQYPIHLLPGNLCASYLRMSPSRFSEEKKKLSRLR